MTQGVGVKSDVVLGAALSGSSKGGGDGRASAMDRQAFLILAHKDDEVFWTLIDMLDYPGNDLFVHMDVKNRRYLESAISRAVRWARVFHTQRTNVRWGGDSQIRAEFLLLRLATDVGFHDYYHLLSGQDLPIQTQETIRQFLSQNRGKEFVQFAGWTFEHWDRVRYYYPLLRAIDPRRSRLARGVNHVGVALQKWVGVDRNRGIEFQKGGNWFTITDDLARHVVSRQAWARKVFASTYCCDEVIMQTIVDNSRFRDRLYYPPGPGALPSSQRLIDWSRGGPYVFRGNDFEEIRGSSALFARKFDSTVDVSIVRRIREAYSSRAPR
ncbi:MAG: beta-1,6-N-acetylglucosaminyltransferase [Propionibacteriaceae bacterium]|nr:beta-1,6-N-acetylglucosaminyltransferase [Propionibacteriaceae bacterium]